MLHNPLRTLCEISGHDRIRCPQKKVERLADKMALRNRPSEFGRALGERCKESGCWEPTPRANCELVASHHVRHWAETPHFLSCSPMTELWAMKGRWTCPCKPLLESVRPPLARPPCNRTNSSPCHGVLTWQCLMTRQHCMLTRHRRWVHLGEPYQNLGT